MRFYDYVVFILFYYYYYYYYKSPTEGALHRTRGALRRTHDDCRGRASSCLQICSGDHRHDHDQQGPKSMALDNIYIYTYIRFIYDLYMIFM